MEDLQTSRTTFHCRTGHRGLKSMAQQLGGAEVGETLRSLVPLRPLCGPPTHRVATTLSLLRTVHIPTFDPASILFFKIAIMLPQPCAQPSCVTPLLSMRSRIIIHCPSNCATVISSLLNYAM